MHMAATSSIAPKQILIDAIVGRKTSDLESLNALIGKWIDTIISTDGAGNPLKDEQKPVLTAYARNYLAVQKLVTGDLSEQSIESKETKEVLDAALEDLNKGIAFSQCQEIFNRAITKLPHANHKELIESSSKLVAMLSEYKVTEESISLADFKEKLSEATDIASYFQENLVKLSKEDFLILQKHLGTIKDLTLCNPGLTIIHKATSQKEVDAFIKAAAKAVKPGPEQLLDAEAMAKIFEENNSKIGDIIIQCQNLMKRNPDFNLESFYTSELSKLNIPASAMKEIIATVQTHHKTDDPEATNDTKDFFSNIAQELMESVPYLAIQAVMGFCSSLLHYIPFVGGTAASILNTTTQVLSSRCMGKAMQSNQKAAPSPAKATPA